MTKVSRHSGTGGRLSAVAIGVPTATVLTWIIGILGVTVPPEVSAAFGAICTYVARVLIPDKIEDE